ncbi:MAG TPA: HlyD family efflux transporter periplasmic adaptor subunit [Gemmatimonadales bacterium]|nr:HlyD family efflux transporter periplasmic adaptor subunit [Gemmatimonadales bacterium]
MNPRPRCRPELRLVEQVYRGELGYIVKDPTTHKYFRFRPVEALVLQSFDGRRTPAEIAKDLIEDGIRLSAAAVEGFARKLSQMGLMERTLGERTTLELERLRAERRKRRQRRFFRGDITRMRWSFGDPNGFLDRTMPWVRWCFTRAFLWGSLALFAVYFLVIAVRWPEFYATLERAYFPNSLTFGTIAMLWCVSIVVIWIHELGHAYTCKVFGGQVHEMGFMLLYFEPCFYCNVNDAWTFPELRARLWVTAAGSWIQFVLAALAAIVWWIAAPGTLVSDVAMATMLVGGVTAILTNMNPLIPLDGYFALSDWLEIPNLRQRAFGHLAWWIKRRLFGVELEEPAATDRERQVFLWYGWLAGGYIVMSLVVFALIAGGWARETFGTIGVLVVVAWLLVSFIKPLRAGASSLMLAFRTRRAAWRARRGLERGQWRFAWVVAAVVIAALLIPRWLTVTGDFTAAPARALALVAPEASVIGQVAAREGVVAPAGASLARLESPDLERLRALAAREADSLAADQLLARAYGWADEVERLDAERASAEAVVRALDARRAALTLRVPIAGQVLTPRPEFLLGHPAQPGDTVLIVGDADSLEVRVRLAGSGASLVRRGQEVSLLPHADPANPRQATVVSIAPAARGSEGLEARVRMAAGGVWRPGSTGEASIRIRRSNVAGALWWGVRKRLRSDLLL